MNSGTNASSLTSSAVGAALRRRRLELGQDLTKIAESLRIRPHYLEAIEAGNFRILPGQTYAFGFVQTYAEYLGLPPKPLVDQLHQELANISSSESHFLPSPVPEERIPGKTILWAATAITLTALGIWYGFSSSNHTVVEHIPSAPPVSEQIPVPSTGTSAPATSSSEAQTNIASAAPTPLISAIPPTPAADTLPKPVSPTPTTASSKPLSPTSASSSEANADVIKIRALADSWIKIYTDDGRALFSKLLHKDETYTPPRQSDLHLMTGNAGGIVISVGGKDLPPLGPRNRVVRDVRLDLDSLQETLRSSQKIPPTP